MEKRLFAAFILLIVLASFSLLYGIFLFKKTFNIGEPVGETGITYLDLCNIRAILSCRRINQMPANWQITDNQGNTIDCYELPTCKSCRDCLR